MSRERKPVRNQASARCIKEVRGQILLCAWARAEDSVLGKRRDSGGKQTMPVICSARHLATVSARLLLDAGDVNGACNRAYYAMCDA